MSRHTLNDGKTPDVRIHEGLFCGHLKILAPSPRLVGAHYRDEIPWDAFENAYLGEIRTSPKSNVVRALASLALETDVTILCIEETPDFCHRRLLAEECQRLKPALQVTHR